VSSSLFLLFFDIDFSSHDPCMTSLDFTTLRCFVAVCDSGSIVQAAQRLHTVPSALSKRLAQLSEDMGTPLLQRHRHGMKPTPAGETLLEHARGLLQNAERLTRDMAAYAQGVRGLVRVLASASAMAESLADDVAWFLQHPAHADIELDLEERVSADVIRGLLEGTASLGICWDAVDTRHLITHPYRCDHLAVVVPPHHPLAFDAHPADLWFADALAYDQVSMPAHTAVQVMLHREAARLGQSLRTRITVANFEAALRVVRAGLAIALVPQEVANQYPQHELVVRPLQDAWAKRQFIIVHPPYISASAQLLVAHLTQIGH
jgi:DNA-binding transcriptional LysR family regulator